MLIKFIEAVSPSFCIGSFISHLTWVCEFQYAREQLQFLISYPIIKVIDSDFDVSRYIIAVKIGY